MKLFDGLGKTDYQDVLRAIGRFIDEHGYRDFRLFETDDGVVIQGRRLSDTKADGSERFETTFFNEQDVETILTEAYKLRKTQGPAVKEQRPKAKTVTPLLEKLRTRP